MLTSGLHQAVEHHQVLPATVLLVDDYLVSLVLSFILQLEVVATVTDCDITQGLLLGWMWIGWFFPMQGQ